MNHDFFSVIDAEVKAYWLGFLFADGCVRSDTNEITLSQKEADHPALFLTTVGSTNKVGMNFSSFGLTHRASVSSQQMKNDLISYGCVPAKSKILGAPVVDMGDFTRDFIRGYNDGDGGFYRSPSRMRMRGTIGLLEFIRDNLPEGSLLYESGPTAQLFVCKNSVLQDTIEYLYKGANVYLDRKYRIAMELCQRDFI